MSHPDKSCFKFSKHFYQNLFIVQAADKNLRVRKLW